MLDRTIIPESRKPADLIIPEHNEYVLPNGMKIFHIENNRFPLMSVRFLIKSGSFSDSTVGNRKYGTANLTAELLTKGAATFNSDYISDFIDSRGAVIFNGAGYDASFLGFSCLNSHFSELLKLVSRLLLESFFPDEEVNKKKKNVISSLTAYADEGSYLAERVFRKKLYGSSPYSYDEDGTISAVKKIVRNDISAFYKKHYYPGNISAAVVGSVSFVKVIDIFSECFYSSEIKTLKKYSNKTNGGKKNKKIYLISKKGAVQSSIHLGHKGVKRKCPDIIPLIVLNTILGGYFSSRINQNIREKNGFSYGARSSFNFYRYSGDFSVETDVSTEKTPDALNEIINEITKIRDYGITISELKSAQKYISGSFPFQLETPNALASKLLSLDLYGVEKDFYNTYISKINSLCIEDINNSAVNYLNPESLLVAIAGNVKFLEEKMKQNAETEVIENIKELEK